MGTALADPLLGTVLDGRYRVGGLVARGGMSTVYAGIDLRLDREVAIKVMAPGMAADPVFVERFGREARAAARLSHTNVVAVYDQGADGGRVFLVMELVRGQTLRDLLRHRGRLSPDEATSLLEPVLAALAAAHRAGLVHRDVKPENVLIASDGTVKVADFGLARAVAAPTTTTQAGIVLGTAAYVAPEQVAAGRADPRTDVYAAGIVLYEMLTGRPPYEGDHAVSVAYRHVHDDVPPPSQTAAGIPAALDELVLRATRREPGARPTDAGAFLAELLHVRVDAGLRRVPVRARTPVTPPVPARGPLPQAPIQTGRPPGWATATLPAPTTRRPPRPRPMRPARPPVPPVPPVAAGWPDERRARRRRLLIGLVCVLLLGGVAALAGWWYGSGRMVEVPRLTGMNQRSAADTVRAASLQVRIGKAEASERVRAGVILRTDPGAGERVVRGSTVTLVPSSGPPAVAVPDVVGKTEDEATQAIRGARLTANTTSEFSSDVEQGRVIRQDPEKNRMVRRGTVVTIVVSKGPDLVQVPEVIGYSRNDAEQALQASGFEVRVREWLGATLNRVLQQSPRPGRFAPRNSTVTITVI